MSLNIARHCYGSVLLILTTYSLQIITNGQTYLLYFPIDFNAMNGIKTMWYKKHWNVVNETNVEYRKVSTSFCLHVISQLHVPSGGSRIFSMLGRQHSGGRTNIRFCQNFPKTAWNLKNLDPGGDASKILLCRSATGTITTSYPSRNRSKSTWMGNNGGRQAALFELA